MSTPPDQANRELHQDLVFAIMQSGTCDDEVQAAIGANACMVVMYRETLAVINRKTGLIVTPEQMQTFDMLRAEQRQGAAKRYGQIRSEE